MDTNNNNSNHSGGSEYQVTRYGTASISRPNTIVVESIEEWEGKAKLDLEENDGGVNTPNGNTTILPSSADTMDPPPPEIPPGLLPRLAREAARENLAKALEYRHPLRRRFVALVFYNIVMLGLVVALSFVPSTELDKDNEFFVWVRWYSRQHWMPWNSLALWEVLLITGWLYISFFVCGRSNPFKSRNESYLSFIGLPIVGIIGWILGPVFTIANGHTIDTSSTDTSNTIFNAIGLDSNSVGYEIVYNYLFYVNPFMIGLQSTYLHYIPAVQKLNSKFNKHRWHLITPLEAILLFILFLFAVASLAFHIYLMAMQDVYLLMCYGIIYVCGALLLYIFALAGAWDGQFGFAFENYFAALVLIPLTRFFNPISAFLQAFIAGIFVESIARWGFTWIFKNLYYRNWLTSYMQWLKRGRDSPGSEEEDFVGAHVLGRLF